MLDPVDSKKSRNLTIQVWISIATLILTPLFTIGVVYFQLGHGHSIWNTQRKLIREEKLLDEKINRLEKTGNIIHQLIWKGEIAQYLLNAIIKVEALSDALDKETNDDFDSIYTMYGSC